MMQLIVIYPSFKMQTLKKKSSIWQTFSSLVTPLVVIMTTYGATSDDNVVKLTTFGPVDETPVPRFLLSSATYWEYMEINIELCGLMSGQPNM